MSSKFFGVLVLEPVILSRDFANTGLGSRSSYPEPEGQTKFGSFVKYSKIRIRLKWRDPKLPESTIYLF